MSSESREKAEKENVKREDGTKEEGEKERGKGGKKTIRRPGLRNVVLAETDLNALSDGNVWYKGYRLKELAEKSSYEEFTFLSMKSRLPAKDRYPDFRESIRTRRNLSPETRGMVDGMEDGSPLELLRTVASSLPVYDESTAPDVCPCRWCHSRDEGKSIVAKGTTSVARHHRIRDGKAPVSPINKLSTPGNYLYMLTGDTPSYRESTALEKTLILNAVRFPDERIGAASIVTRTAASTKTDLTSCITASLAAVPDRKPDSLSAVELLDTVIEGSEEDAVDGIKDVPGFSISGIRDPRTDQLEEIARDLGGDEYLQAADEIAKYLSSDGSKLEATSALYRGVIYRELPIPDELFLVTTVFGRIQSWFAQVLTQYDSDTLIRPRACYTGRKGRVYTGK
ncbi:MAG: citrate/2-methylcitrate synthase [Halobacteria archaeon]